ncbi:MAG: lysophospholipid acyltransferase family protein [Butyrivibrio sp.]
MVDVIITVMSIAAAYFYTAFCSGYGNGSVWVAVLVFAIAFIVFYVGAALLFWIFCIIVSLTVNKNKEYRHSSRFFGILFGLMCEYAVYLSGGRVHVKGKELIPKNEKFLFVSNHRSKYDTIVQVGELKRHQIAFISKPSNFKIPVGSRYMRRCRYLCLDREDLRSGTLVTRTAASMISSGESSIGVYPEGTRNKELKDTLLTFKPGCFKTALWAKCPIVVSVIRGTELIHKRFPFRRSKIIFEIVEVIPYDTIKDMKTQEISNLVESIMLKRLP